MTNYNGPQMIARCRVCGREELLLLSLEEPEPPICCAEEMYLDFGTYCCPAIDNDL